MQLSQLDDYLRELFEFSNFVDVGVNGIQVENAGQLHTLAFAVDSTLKTIESAVLHKADILIVHHGLFWGQCEPITSIMYQKLKLLLDHNIALYAIHLPLDAHPTLGNNMQIAQALKIEKLVQNLTYQKLPLGFVGSTTKTELIKHLTQNFSKSFSPYYQQIIQSLPQKTLKVGISSGAFSSTLFSENHHKVDIFLTGEVNLPTFNLATDYKTPIIPLGHYFTEVFGISALMTNLEEKKPLLNFKFIVDDKYI